MQARFTVQVLALEAQVLRGVPVDRCAFPQAAAPGTGSSAPDGAAAAVGHAVRQAVQFRVVPEDVRVLTVAVDTRQRFIAVFGVDILHRRVRVNVAGFAHLLQAGSGVLRALRFPGMASPHLFLRTAAQGVVAVLGPGVFRIAVDFHPADAVFVVIAEALRHSPVRVVAHGHAPETVILAAHAVQAFQQVVPYRLHLRRGAVVRRVIPETLLFIRLQNL